MDANGVLGAVFDEAANALRVTDTGPVVYSGAQFVRTTSTTSAVGNFPGRGRVFSTTISGGSAGAHAVTGITFDDDIVAVLHFTSGALTTDLTSEFTISDNDEIDNTSGTDTTGDQLFVVWSAPGNYKQAGMSFPTDIRTRAVMPLLAPASWPSVRIDVLALADNFGSGNVMLEQGAPGGGDTVTVTCTNVYVGELAFTGPTWSPGSGVFADYQFAQLPIARYGDNVADTLNEGFSVLFVALTNGG